MPRKSPTLPQEAVLHIPPPPPPTPRREPDSEVPRGVIIIDLMDEDPSDQGGVIVIDKWYP